MPALWQLAVGSLVAKVSRKTIWQLKLQQGSPGSVFTWQAVFLLDVFMVFVKLKGVKHLDKMSPTPIFFLNNNICPFSPGSLGINP